MTVAMYAMKDRNTRTWLEYKGHDDYQEHDTPTPQFLYTRVERDALNKVLNPDVVYWVTVHVTVEGE